jgi:hypothetical protein
MDWLRPRRLSCVRFIYTIIHLLQLMFESLLRIGPVIATSLFAISASIGSSVVYIILTGEALLCIALVYLGALSGRLALLSP